MLIIFIFFALLSVYRAEEPNYAVVEYHPFDNNLTANVEKYVEIITGYDKILDLIVFPENTLHYGISNEKLDEYSTFIEKGNNPCLLNKTYPNFIIKLSCAAKTKKTFVVVNTVEKEKCATNAKDDNCKKFGNHYYNTDLVFNKDGFIETRYRKYNLFGEAPLNTPFMEDITFLIDETKFGIFTCFDILFQTPAEKLVKDDGINYIIFPTMWFSELPFLTALQTQQMWSMAHNVTLLAAGANNLTDGSGGSGIFQGISKNPISPIIQGEKDEGTSTVIDVSTTTPKIDENFDRFKLKKDPILNEMNATLLILDESTPTVISHNDISCKINVVLQQSTISDTSSYTYYAVAHSGVRSFSGVYNGGVDICGIIACTEKNDIKSCGTRLPDSNPINWPVHFSKITIEAEIQGIENRTQYPNSVLQNLQPILPTNLKWTKEELENTTKIQFELTVPQENILTFAVYGRNFGLDSPNNSSGNKFNLLTSFFSLLVAIFVIKYFN